MVNLLCGSVQDRINYIKAARPDVFKKDVEAFVNYNLFVAPEEELTDELEVVQGNIKTSYESKLVVNSYSSRRVVETFITISVDDRKVFVCGLIGGKKAGWKETTYNEKHPNVYTETWSCGLSSNTILLKDRNMVLRTWNGGSVVLSELNGDGKPGEDIWDNSWLDEDEDEDE